MLAPALAEKPPAPRRFRLQRLPKWIDTVFAGIGAALLVYVVACYPLGTIAAACRQLGPWVVLVFLLPLEWHASGAVAVWLSGSGAGADLGDRAAACLSASASVSEGAPATWRSRSRSS